MHWFFVLVVCTRFMYYLCILVICVCTSYMSYLYILVVGSSSGYWGAAGAPILFSEIMLTYGFLFVVLYIYIYIYLSKNGGRAASFRFLA